MSLKNTKRIVDCSSTLRVYGSATYNIPFLGLMSKKGTLSPIKVYERVYEAKQLFWRVYGSALTFFSVGSARIHSRGGHLVLLCK